MNKVDLIGRLTKDPAVGGEGDRRNAHYTLAVDRRVAKGAEKAADFISITAFGKAADFAEKYLHKGTKIAVSGHIQTGSYTDRNGQKVYTTQVIVEEQEFVESKGAAQNNAPADGNNGGFKNIPDGIEENLPFS